MPPTGMAVRTCVQTSTGIPAIPLADQPACCSNAMPPLTHSYPIWGTFVAGRFELCLREASTLQQTPNQPADQHTQGYLPWRHRPLLPDRWQLHALQANDTCLPDPSISNIHSEPDDPVAPDEPQTEVANGSAEGTVAA